MNTYAPDYYKKFKCTADKCRHTCCIGWEIDIDKKTLDYYKSVQGPMGSRLKENISSGREPHFVLGKGDRCPFLNQDNLCDIYTELGQEHLCQICSDHPRFRNFFENRVEIGLGMCCEAAAKLILENQDKVRVALCEGSETEDDDVFFNMRQKAFEIVQNREVSMDKRITKLRGDFDVKIPERTFGEWIDFYLTLENLEPVWKELLEKAQNTDFTRISDFNCAHMQIALEQLLVYFIYRHTADAVYENNMNVRLAFALLSYEMVKYITLIYGDVCIESMAEVARMYSAEIEYSAENTDELLFELENELF